MTSPYRVTYAAGLLLGCTGLGTFGSVLRATLGAILYAAGVEGATDDVVADTGKVFHTAATDKHDRVLLKVVAFTGDV